MPPVSGSARALRHTSPSRLPPEAPPARDHDKTAGAHSEGQCPEDGPGTLKRARVTAVRERRKNVLDQWGLKRQEGSVPCALSGWISLLQRTLLGHPESLGRGLVTRRQPPFLGHGASATSCRREHCVTS